MFGGLKIDFVSLDFVFFLIKPKLFFERVSMVLTFLDTNYVALPYLRESDIMSMTKLSGDAVIYSAQTTAVYGNKYGNRIHKEWDTIVP